eukprot:1160418-Pelagomonas_calceolata.AAC.1
MESDKVKILRLMSAGGATWLLDAPHWRCCRSSQVACEVSTGTFLNAFRLLSYLTCDWSLPAGKEIVVVFIVAEKGSSKELCKDVKTSNLPGVCTHEQELQEGVEGDEGDRTLSLFMKKCIHLHSIMMQNMKRQKTLPCSHMMFREVENSITWSLGLAASSAQPFAQIKPNKKKCFILQES